MSSYPNTAWVTGASLGIHNYRFHKWKCEYFEYPWVQNPWFIVSPHKIYWLQICQFQIHGSIKTHETPASKAPVWYLSTIDVMQKFCTSPRFLSKSWFWQERHFGADKCYLCNCNQSFISWPKNNSNPQFETSGLKTQKTYLFSNAKVKYFLTLKVFSIYVLYWFFSIYRNYWNRSRLCIILDSNFPRLLMQVDLY